MIVVCTGCSTKFKVADDKVGPKGAKVRCSRCRTVFRVHRDPEVVRPPAAPAPPGPPPLPRRASGDAPARPASPEVGPPLDARAALDIDLEPTSPRAPPAPGPQAPAPVADPFAAGLDGEAGGGAPEAAGDPFAAASPAAPDPFAAVQAPIPADLLRAPPAGDPFGPSAPAEEAFAAAGAPFGARDLSLEEPTTPPARRLRPESSAPVGDPFAVQAADELAADLAAGRPDDVPPLAADLPGLAFTPAPLPPAPPPEAPAPLHEDPFAAAAVDAEPLRMASPRPARPPEPSRPAAPAAAERVGAAPPAGPGRLRALALNAVSLAALLVVALAIVLAWRGHVPLSQAFRPSALVDGLVKGPGEAGPLSTAEVASGLYERASGPPLLFVKGVVVSGAGAPVPGAVVSFELTRGAAVLASGEVLAGAVLTPEELHGAVDGEALRRLQAAADARAPSEIGPGQQVPFLAAVAGAPADLAGATVRVRVRPAGGG